MRTFIPILCAFVVTVTALTVKEEWKNFKVMEAFIFLGCLKYIFFFIESVRKIILKSSGREPTIRNFPGKSSKNS